MRICLLIPCLALACGDSGTQLPPSIRLLPVAASPERGSVTVVAQRTGSRAGAVTASYATTNASAIAGADYATSTGTLQWADGDVADKMIAIAITDDLAIEGD